MRFTLSALLLAAVTWAVVADDVKKGDDTKKAEKKGDGAETPDQKFNDLMKRYSETVIQFQKNMQAAKTDDERKKFNDEFQPKHEKLAREALDLAKANPKAAFVMRALALATRDDTTDTEALKFAVDTFVDDVKILDLVPMLAFRPDGKALLAKLAESKNKDVRGGVQFIQITNEIDRLDSNGKAKPDELAKGFAEARKKLDALVKEYGDASVRGPQGPTKLSDAANEVVYMLDNLTVGKVLGDVDCPVLDSDKKAKVSDYRGKVVVLDIWATWCGPCRAMIPHERDMVKKLDGKPFALISVSADEKKETLTKFLEKTEMPWTHWHAGENGALISKYQVKFFPTIYVLDAKGVIRHKNIRDKDLEHAVEELLKETAQGEKK
ncbi:thiol-disulfide isomerase-like thioredoxin : Thiol-disulfide isomerase-like thioredoxin OS=Singulisphaera acidiphila (strain ATCC BAA-1392 / DSM 18658 / VKM B-2454 / MOB10) GN=Sinac_5190 PE=4 SV=1: Thioredoxin_8 [Gemmata massiliana]|uniref:Thioredoxin domain-containing protein n=1 Tax=Gemmata massiliana TaxID=1210884 RepID=A0A6P2D3C8_9BACT|nr:TlpA disulfide reductase family protein [Gemmata massiliana]VTR95818.1 thiol-disulfide isomerase-like thioredoxin : Thiol-disulfide isomerase-like thioredoxin OS=Singulisphaera acidiphila (strain ATCC BAA-1392 / DSM 18658 / VKM B-2454 / MOB10) GN=Sinac_5190 PE=4 SV=1: Thioredoxin_8 [Gemmata massiliana]